MSNNTNIKLTVEAWADIVIKEWLNKISLLDIKDTNELYNSFSQHIVAGANGDVQRIDFAFLYYGKFSDMGVGKGVTIGQHVDSGRTPNKWYSPVLTYQVNKLRELLVAKYAHKGAMGIIEKVNVNKS